MTRLCTEDISHIANNLITYNNELIAKTGCSLAQIAEHAVGIDNSSLCLKHHKAAVIPMTSGQGIIGGFASTVASIVNFLGVPAVVTENTDAAGLAEAYQKKASLILLADDLCFICINLLSGKVVDNSEATGKGYAVALDKMVKMNRMAGGLKGQNVLLVGAGRVGKSAASTMAKLGACLGVYEIRAEAKAALIKEITIRYKSPVKEENCLHDALDRYHLIFDASPIPGFIDIEHVGEGTFIAAAGMPLGVTAGAYARVSKRILHDPLQIGVAAMVFEALN
ncbi:MAG: 3-methylornithyl-N6-L-lysine dehydrogenase PylD [Bacillota bacterium]